MTTPTLYVRRTREVRWHWCGNCPEYPLGILDSNGVLTTMTKPEGDFCPKCIRLTREGGCAA